MTDINTLIPDIYSLVKRKDGWFNEHIAKEYSDGLAKRIQVQFGERQGPPTLRMSQMGHRCPKALWHSIHTPELAESLPSHTEIKFCFGHSIEALAIALAKGAGHEVTGEQDELVFAGIVGHRDCVIDGHTVDVKSASSIGFNEFKSGTFVDLFGYLDQLDGYVLAAAEDPLVRVKNKGYDLVIDRQLGHMCLYEHTVTPEREATLRSRINTYKDIVGQKVPPACECGTREDGAGGNIRLDTKASYSPFKYTCFPNLRTFIYAKGPVYLAQVFKRPWNKDGPITEVDKEGKIVYH